MLKQELHKAVSTFLSEKQDGTAATYIKTSIIRPDL
jgi:hypothetical protein